MLFRSAISAAVLFALLSNGLTVTGQDKMESADGKTRIIINENPGQKEVETAEIMKLIEDVLDSEGALGVEVSLQQVVRQFRKAVNVKSVKAKEWLPVLKDRIGSQYDWFCRELERKAAEDNTLVNTVIELRKHRDDFVEARSALFHYAAEGEPVPEMESEAFDDLCRQLDIQVGLDHALHLGAPHPELAIVTLRLPGLDCPGCAKVIETKLTNLGVQSFEKNIDERKCRFLVPRDFDMEGKLDELAETVKQFENWKFAR